MSIATELAATRAELFDALAPIPDVSVYPTEPDAADLPAVWVDQPAANRSDPGRLVSIAWRVVIAVESTSGPAVGDALDALIGVVVDTVATVTGARFDGWTRGEVAVGGVSVPAAVVAYITDHVANC